MARAARKPLRRAVILGGLPALVLCASMVTDPPAAFAAGAKNRESSQEDPEGLIEQGVRLRRQGHNDRAEGYLRRAYKLARTPRSAVQLGLVEFALGRYLSAEGHLSEAMASPDDTWVASHWAILEKSRTEVRSHLGHVEVLGAPADARVTVNGGSPTPLSNDGWVWVEPGKVVLTLTMDTETMTSPSMAVGPGGIARWKVPARAPVAAPVRSVVAAPATPVAVNDRAGASHPAEVAANSPPPPAEPDDGRGGGLRLTGLVMAPAGLVIGGVGYLLLARGNAMADNITNSQTSGARYDESDGRYGTFQKAGIGLIVGGAAVAVTGVILYLVGRAEGDQIAEGAEKQAELRPRWMPRQLRFSLNPRLSPADATIVGVGGVL